MRSHDKTKQTKAKPVPDVEVALTLLGEEDVQTGRVMFIAPCMSTVCEPAEVALSSS